MQQVDWVAVMVNNIFQRVFEGKGVIHGSFFSLWRL
jgi:hypothetical protein